MRLVGDDQQLAAIGAGGVLRDIKQTHGALHLAELHRFTDPAEAAASLALRDGKPTALTFYLNNGRIHAELSVELPPLLWHDSPSPKITALGSQAAQGQLRARLRRPVRGHPVAERFELSHMIALLAVRIDLRVEEANAKIVELSFGI